MIFAISANVVTGIGFSLFIILPLLAWLFSKSQYVNGEMISPVKRFLNLRQPFYQRHSEDIASGKLLYIQGRLSRTQQIMARVLQIIAIIFSVVFITKQPEHMRSTIYLIITILAFIIVIYKGRRGLKYVRRKDSQYYPPPPSPNETLYFDYKGTLIASKHIKEWKDYFFGPNITILLVLVTYQLSRLSQNLLS